MFQGGVAQMIEKIFLPGGKCVPLVVSVSSKSIKMISNHFRSANNGSSGLCRIDQKQ